MLVMKGSLREGGLKVEWTTHGGCKLYVPSSSYLTTMVK